MLAEEGLTLHPESARKVAKAVPFALGVSREGVNNTPVPGVGRITFGETVTWFAKVTGARDSLSGEGATRYPGTLFRPDPSNLGEWLEADCWVRSVPGQTLAAEDTGAARLVGRHSDGKPVYAIVRGGDVRRGTFGVPTEQSGEDWKWRTYKRDADGIYQLGDESSEFDARPLAHDGTNLCGPVAGRTAWFWRSETDFAEGEVGQRPQYEFLPLTCPDEADPDTSTTRGPGWVSSLSPATCLNLSVVRVGGDCSSIDDEQELDLAWDGDGWSSVDLFVYDAGAGVARFWVEDGRPRASIDGVDLVWEGAGYDGTHYVEFAGGTGTGLCDDSAEVEAAGSGSGSGSGYTPPACGESYFVVRVRCGACPVAECGDFTYPALLCVRVTSEAVGWPADGVDVVARWDNLSGFGGGWYFTTPSYAGASGPAQVWGWIVPCCDPTHWRTGVPDSGTCSEACSDDDSPGAGCPSPRFVGASNDGAGLSVAYEPFTYVNQETTAAEPEGTDGPEIEIELYGGSFTVRAQVDCDGDGSGGGDEGDGEEFFDLGESVSVTFSNGTGDCGCLDTLTVATLTRTSPTRWENDGSFDSSGCPDGDDTEGVGLTFTGDGWRLIGLCDGFDCTFVMQDAVAKIVVIDVNATSGVGNSVCTGTFRCTFQGL